MQPVRSNTRVYHILTWTFEHKLECGVYFAINYGCVCTLIWCFCSNHSFIDPHPHISFVSKNWLHFQVGYWVLSRWFTWLWPGSVQFDSIRFGPTQFSSLCFNSSRSNSISIDFDSLTSFHRNINHVRSAALAHYLSLSCSPDPVLHRSGKYVFQVQYMNTQHVIDYEMVNFMATHTTFPGNVELLSWFNRFRYWATHNQHIHFSLQCTRVHRIPYLLFSRSLSLSFLPLSIGLCVHKESTSHFHFIENCYFIGKKIFHYTLDS